VLPVVKVSNVLYRKAFRLEQWFPNFSDRVLFVGPVLSTRTILFLEKSMCQI